MLNKYIPENLLNDLNISGDERNKIIAEFKMRIWDLAMSLANERNENLSQEIISEVVNNIDSLDGFLKQYKSSVDFDWELNKIVDEDFCAKCGTCTVVCPNNILEFTNVPQLKEECLRNGHGMCYEVCPRVSSGKYQIKIRSDLNEEFYYGKGSVKGQDGGVVTTFLKYLLNESKIDGAIVVGDDHWKPVSLLVKTPDSLDKTAKSKYTISTLDALTKAGELGIGKVAVVALPCQIAGLRKLQYFPYLAKYDEELGRHGKPAVIPKIEYLIGLFCSEKFDYANLEESLEANNINIDDVSKFEVKGGKLKVNIDNQGNEEIKEINIKQIAMSSGCKLCKDFDGELADVSVGSVGSHKGYSTIITRSEKGREIANALELKEGINFDAFNKLKNIKIKRFNKTLKERKEKGEFISYYWNSDFPGISKQKDGDYFIRIRTNPSGWYDTDEIESINEVAKLFNAKIKLTVRGAFELHNIKEEDVEEIVNIIKNKNFIIGSQGPLVRSILACSGENSCSSGLFDTTALCKKLEENFMEYPTPYKFKIAISGCPNKCVRPQIQDFGISAFKFPETKMACNACGRCADTCKLEAIEIKDGIAVTDYDLCIGCSKCFKSCPHGVREVKEEGYMVYIGGKSGRELIEGFSFKIKSEKEIFTYLDAVLKVYDKLAIKPQRERLATTILRVGRNKFISELNLLIN